MFLRRSACTGHIPEELGTLRKLRVQNVRHNQLAGERDEYTMFFPLASRAFVMLMYAFARRVARKSYYTRKKYTTSWRPHTTFVSHAPIPYSRRNPGIARTAQQALKAPPVQQQAQRYVSWQFGVYVSCGNGLIPSARGRKQCARTIGKTRESPVTCRLAERGRMLIQLGEGPHLVRDQTCTD